VNARRFIISMYLVVFAGTLLMSGVFFWQTRAEYRQLQEVERRSARRLAELELRLKEQQVILDRLRNDPAFVERVIRRQLKYAKPDEYIFRFEE
jgi:cell division protein FtsB